METQTAIKEDTLLKRVNRRLQKQGQTIRITREGSDQFNELGRYSILDINKNQVVQKHVDLNELGKNLKAFF